ncbi:mitochondrial antiviral-signaling protein [Mugil cephalus]|uniref:mitochondrial antiviral-signaling protein n=1 Tax=Mugil cephalus TaxID=48193 RepID=UPI001FB7A29C|nr:mitochondrial antiviral-signaling protein [Mugil cephalus]
MSFVRDKLYNGYVRRNMATIAKNVDVSEIMMHLPCLTIHDRENIEARTNNHGKSEGMVRLLECLRKRENWPEQLIEALEACEHPTIADEIRENYNSLRGISKSDRSPPPVSVSSVHPTPASRESIPVTVAAEPATKSPPNQILKPAPPTEPLPEPPQPAQVEAPPRPSTPPPSPETQYSEATAAPLPYLEVNSHLEPEESSESDIQDDTGATTDRPQLSPEHCEPGARAWSEDRPPQSPSLLNSNRTGESSFLTPEKPPVQDTAPPVCRIPTPILQPEETSEPPATQTVERRPETETGATVFPAPGDHDDDDDDDEDDVCLSKPGHLVSIQPQSEATAATFTASTLPQAPYSGDSGRLEMSEGVSASSAAKSVSALQPCQENGCRAPEYNEPEENHYESPRESLDSQEVLVNVGRVTEEPSILNQDGQSSAPPQPSPNKAAVSSLNPSCSETCPPSGTKGSSSALSANGKYILTALGVGACAMLVVWSSVLWIKMASGIFVDSKDQVSSSHILGTFTPVMSLAGDKLCNGYLRRKMPTIVSKVKVRDLIIHLSCLTADDRESIEAKREVCGNYDGMVLLLDCLKKTENWPEQFIKALEACGQTTIAAEVRAEYNAVKGTDDSDPSSPPTTVVRAHVHPAPSASPVSLPESGGNTQAIPALEITAQPQPPQSTEVPESVSSSELPHSTLMEVPPLPSTPPPSPDTPHIEVTLAPLSQKEINSRLAPEGNLESGQQPDPKEDRPPESPASPAQIKSDVTDGPSVIAPSTKKPSVQDAAPLVGSVLQPDNTSEPPAAPVVESRPQTGAEPGPVSVEPQSRTSPTVPAPSSPVDSSSGHSDTSRAAPASSAGKTVTAVSCQENGFAPNHNKPEGNHYEPREKLETQEPSVPKLDVRTSTPPAQTVNGEVAKEAASAPPPRGGAAAATSLNAPNTEPETKTLLQDSEETTLLQSPLNLLANRKYIMTAVGVGACAMLMAWKMKN